MFNDNFDQAVLDGLPVHVALLGPDGQIEMVNKTWRTCDAASVLRAKNFAVGLNYLALCEDARGEGADIATQMSRGVRAVLRGDTPLFELEYPCHSPNQRFWFRALVTPVYLQDRRCALITHVNTTDYALAQLTLKRSESEQRALVLELGRERERLVIAQAVAKLGCWEANLLTFEEFWSDETYKIFEVDRDQFTPTCDGFLALVHPDDRDAVAAAFKASFFSKDTKSIEHRLLLSDGRVKYINETWQIFVDGDGVPIKAVGTCQDTTERHAAGEKLLESERELRQSRLHLAIAQRVASIGSAAIDFRTGKWDWSDETFRVYGFEPGAFTPTAEKLSALVHPDDRNSLLSNIPLARMGITPPPLEYRITRPDGVERILRRDATLVRDDAGEVLGIVGAVQDVTDRRAAQHAKAEADSRLMEQAAMLSNAQRIGRMGSWNLNLRNGQLSWSDATYELFGITPTEFRGTFEHFMSLIVAEDLSSYKEAHAGVSPEAPLLQAQYRIRRPDGAVRWMYERGNATFDEMGNALNRVGMVSDITEQRNLEAQLREATRLEAIGQLTGGIAHDFNNLLTVVLGNAEALSAELKGDEALYPLAELTLQAAERGAELTRRLLAFARRQPLAPKVTDVNELLLGMKALLRRTIEGDIDIDWNCDNRLGNAIIDASQLENVVLNLCINARDAMGNGGRLTIKTNNVDLEEHHFGINAEIASGRYVQIAISDTGTGMDSATLTRVFEPFFTTKDVSKGSGLGLSMAYGFIKQSNGQIRIDSEIGCGTTVNLYLPMAFGSINCDGADAAKQDLPGGYEKILMVEDDDLVRTHVSGQLKRLGYEITDVPNGHDALRVLKDDGDFALLFTDLMLPGGLNGRRLADEVRKLRPKIAILFTSGYSNEQLDRQEGVAGHSGLLSKPYHIQDLAVGIRRALSKKPDSIH